MRTRTIATAAPLSSPPEGGCGEGRRLVRGIFVAVAVAVAAIASTIALAALLVFALPAHAQAPTPEGAPIASAGLDAGLVDLEQKLEALLRGELAKSKPVAGLFGVALDDRAAVAKRIVELEAQIAEQGDRAAALRARSNSLTEAAARDSEPIAPAERPASAPPPSSQNEAVPVDAVPQADTAGARDEADAERVSEQAAAEAAAIADASVARADELRRSEEYATRVEARARERAEVEAKLASLELNRSVARKRLAYLRALTARSEGMTDATRRILPLLAEPRTALRTHAEALRALAEAEVELARRYAALGRRVTSGMVVGFVSDQRELGDDLAVAASTFEQQAEDLAGLAGGLSALAERLEAESREVRDVLFRSIGRDDGQQALDEAFLEHLRAQRRLRKSVGDQSGRYGLEALAAMRARAEGLVPAPYRVATIADAREILEAGVDFRTQLTLLRAAEAESTASWALAIENELVTVLSDVASRETLDEAYGFSSELIDDLKSEWTIALSRGREWLDAQRSATPDLRAWITDEQTRPLLLRSLGVVLIVCAWLFVRRQTPKLTVLLVKTLARLPFLRSNLGQLVRWSGLIQAVLPALLGLLALWLARTVMGPETPLAELANAIFAPWLFYLLGRQLILGATRRISSGRPALIQVQASTLEGLKRTYATLGIVLASAWALDGVARVAVGAGRLVSLLDGLVTIWVAVWAVVEAWRWRAWLARAWAACTHDEEPPGRERRIALWMERSRLGLVLSPFALLRIVGTRLSAPIRDLATETDLVQGLRARMLRRRSGRIDPATRGVEVELPPAYLEAFPLYPVLGEDDALIVSRKDVLEEIVQQWRRWQEKRADGSLVLVGEKGAGKTTLAAQLAREARDAALVQHTIRGKPTRRDELVQDLCGAFELEGVEDVATLCERLNEGEDRVAVLDEAHNVFLREIDGYGAYDALVDVVNGTSKKVFWVLIFNRFTWQFLNASRSRAHSFRRILDVPQWSPEEIQRLIRLRHERTGFELRFDEVLLSGSRSSSGSLELVEEAEGYFRLLWESSAGNPRIATRLWLSSLRPISEDTMAVGIFPDPHDAMPPLLQEDLLFALAAICQHENLSNDEMTRVLNLPEEFSRFATQYLAETGLVEAKDGRSDRFTLAPRTYRAVLRLLRSKHLLYD